MKKVSVVIPMYYEQEVVDVCYKRVKKVLEELKEKYEHEIIFINDGSKDKTLDILQDIAKVDKNVWTSSGSNGRAKVCDRGCNYNNRCGLARSTRVNTRYDRKMGAGI